KRMELSVDRVNYIKQLLNSKIRLSLDKSLDDNDSPESNASLKLASMKADREDDINPGFRALMNEAILNAVERCVSLSSREKEVIMLRFGLGGERGSQTLQEIGNHYNLTRERIRQIEEEAISKLRADPNFEKSVKDFVC
ncbi:MAG TPA: sigma factor-like helix-turn-helix DNA-binding protein, partial [Candidatus Paceibacterota bacterium]|nr:sigma factor-like helix-turn-helix DNA-binding protein [Candidatus Paceibacterota bacterium]